MKYKILFVFLILGLFLRFYHLDSKTPFDWDQERDMQVLKDLVQSHKPTLIGPVVKGEGGFLLGPLYTYVLLPGYLISGGHPLSAPITNILIDISVGIILFFLSSYAGIIWFLSPLIVTNSLIAWNVGLIPLWSVLLLWFYKKYSQNHKLFFYILAFFAGLAWHVHASLIPLALIWLVLYFLFNFKKLSFNAFIFAFIAYLIPLSSLLMFDLRHDFTNTKLLFNYLTHQELVSYTFIVVITDTLKKYLLLISSIIYKNLILGLLLNCLFIYEYLKRPSIYSRIFLYSALPTIILLIMLHDPTYPEYYLSVILVPSVLLISALLERINPKFSMLIPIFLLTWGIYNSTMLLKLNNPYSLKAKEQVVESIASHHAPVDIRYELAPGRGSGLPYLFARNNVKIQENSQIHIVIKDKQSEPNNIDNRPPVSIDHLGAFAIETYITPVVK